MTDLQITYLGTNALKPWARNARTHSKKQIRQLAASINELGFTNPILIDSENTVLAGRIAAAQLLGMTTVPCVRIESMTPAQKRAYVVADNKLALNAGWDVDLLAEELKGLLEDGDGFDVSLNRLLAPSPRHHHQPVVKIDPYLGRGSHLSSSSS